MMPYNLFVSRELADIVSKLHDFMATHAGLNFDFEDSRAEFTAIYIRNFKHCKCQITVFNSAPTPPPPPISGARKPPPGFFVEGNCLEGDRFLFRRLWAEIKRLFVDDGDVEKRTSTAATEFDYDYSDEWAIRFLRSDEWDTIVSRASSVSSSLSSSENLLEFHSLICEFTLHPSLIPILITEKNIIDYLLFHLVKIFDPWCFQYAALALENICVAILARATKTNEEKTEEAKIVVQRRAKELCRIAEAIVRDDGNKKFPEAQRACAHVFRLLWEELCGEPITDELFTTFFAGESMSARVIRELVHVHR